MQVAFDDITFRLQSCMLMNINSLIQFNTAEIVSYLAVGENK